MRDVTIVISNYNYGRYLSSAIESCLEQTHQCDVIVIDDVSTDNSWQVIKQYGVVGVRLKENSGANSRGKNIGIALCSTPYVTCLDSDDMLLPESIQDRLDAFSQDTDFVHGCMIRVASTEAWSSISKRIDTSAVQSMNGFSDPSSITDALSWYRGIAASTVIARRTLYEQFGLYDEQCRYKEDREMWYRWLSHGVRRGYIHKNVSVYRHHNLQATRLKSKKSPKVVDAYFDKVIIKRRHLDRNNTLMMQDFDPHQYIAEMI